MTNETRARLYGEMTKHPLWADYQHWLTSNQAIITELVARAREVKASGREQYSLRALWEVARYELEITRAEGDTYALNNNLAPLVARTIMLLAPDLGPDFFEFRQPKQRINATPEQALSA